MFKILQARLQQYVNRELPDIQEFQKNIYFCFIDYANASDCVDHKNCTKFCWIIEKAREFQKNIYLSIIDYAKAFDYVDHYKLENS